MKASRSVCRRRQALRSADEVQDSFIKGFVSAGLLAGVQGGGDRPPPSPAAVRRILRLALQGGTALSAGSLAAAALQRQAPGSALAAIAAGTAGLILIEHLLRDEASASPDTSTSEDK